MHESIYLHIALTKTLECCSQNCTHMSLESQDAREKWQILVEVKDLMCVSKGLIVNYTCI